MTGITPSHSDTAGRLGLGLFQGIIDAKADKYLDEGDQKLQEIAAKVGAVFLNQHFYTICCCNYSLSIKEIVASNPNFRLMDKNEINRSINLIVFNKHKDLVDLIASKLSTDNAISALGAAIKHLKFYSDRANKDNQINKAQEYDNMLHWSLNRQSDMVTNSTQADKAASDHLSCLHHHASANDLRPAIDQSLAKIIAKVSSEFLNKNFYQMCASNLTLSLREAVTKNKNFREIDREEAFGSAALLAINKQKDLIENVAHKITYDSSNISSALAPSIIFMNRVISQLEFSSKNCSGDEEYKEMLEWARQLLHNLQMTITFELDSHISRETFTPINEASISIPLRDVLDSCIIS